MTSSKPKILKNNIKIHIGKKLLAENLVKEGLNIKVHSNKVMKETQAFDDIDPMIEQIKNVFVQNLNMEVFKEYPTQYPIPRFPTF